MKKNEDEKFDYTFCIIKPDSMKYKEEIVKMIEENEFRVVYAKCQYLTKEKVQEHYAHCKHLDVYPKIIESMLEGPVMLLIIYDHKGDAINRFRKLQGATNSAMAEEGTIRNVFGSRSEVYKNATHASSSPQECAQEICRFFKNDIDDILSEVYKLNELNKNSSEAYHFIDSKAVIKNAQEEYMLRKKYNGEK